MTSENKGDGEGELSWTGVQDRFIVEWNTQREKEEQDYVRSMQL